jgi:hypothetical protein
MEELETELLDRSPVSPAPALFRSPSASGPKPNPRFSLRADVRRRLA